MSPLKSSTIRHLLHNLVNYLSFSIMCLLAPNTISSLPPSTSCTLIPSIISPHHLALYVLSIKYHKSYSEYSIPSHSPKLIISTFKYVHPSRFCCMYQRPCLISIPAVVSQNVTKGTSTNDVQFLDR